MPSNVEFSRFQSCRRTGAIRVSPGSFAASASAARADRHRERAAAGAARRRWRRRRRCWRRCRAPASARRRRVKPGVRRMRAQGQANVAQRARRASRRCPRRASARAAPSGLPNCSRARRRASSSARPVGAQLVRALGDVKRELAVDVALQSSRAERVDETSKPGHVVLPRRVRRSGARARHLR